MAERTLPMMLSKQSQKAVIDFYKNCVHSLQANWNVRAGLEEIDRYYQREGDFTEDQLKARAANRMGDKTKFQNITVPLIMPQVEAGVSYMTSVFATGEPIFPVVSSPENADAALQLTALMSKQARLGGWRNNLIKHFRNGLKYNLAAMEVIWEQRTVPVFQTVINVRADARQVLTATNVLRNLDVYNTFFDTRVVPTDIARFGEFAGYHKMMNRPAFKEFVNSLPNKIIANVVPALESGGGAFSVGGSGSTLRASAMDAYYIPMINPDAFIRNPVGIGTDWHAWLTGDRAREIQYSNSYLVTVLYGRILPMDFGIRAPAEATPQVWRFIIINNEVVLYAERLTNAHNLIPILFSQPLDDGLGYQTKSFASNLRPMQDIASALWNAAIASRRRAISDRVLYDPSRVATKDINSDSPAAKIPVRPTAYGKNIADAVFPFPYREDQAIANLTQVAEVVKMAEMISGQNRPFQGQFIRGNRTMHEYQDVMDHNSGRNQLIAITLEDQLISAIKDLVAINILEYQPPTQVFSPELQQMIDVDPARLREAMLEFKIGDGLIPTDALIHADSFKVALTAISTTPQLSVGYNLTELFSYLMKTQGADLRPFEKSREEMAYEQQLAVWQQAAQTAAEKGTAFDTPMPQPPAAPANVAAAGPAGPNMSPAVPPAL